MNDLNVKKIIEICDGYLYCGDENEICTLFSKDTRTIKKGDTYIGIKGTNFDGNLFYKEAIKNGATVCILEKSSFKNIDIEKKATIILVDNSIKTLKNLAIYKRNNSQAIFIGITGSVGKTSTRDMIYSVLNEKFKTLKTIGNYNNNIGLPLTLLRLKDEEVAVVEMGMNNLGEIDYLSKIAKPNIGVITNIGTAHIGLLGSRENILKAKLEILNGMDENGLLIINNDNDLLNSYYEKNKKNIITIGIQNKSNFYATDITLLEDSSKFIINYNDKKVNVTCPIPGLAFIYNSLISFAIGNLLKIAEEDIVRGIENFTMTKNRLETFTSNGVTVINDSYNASVDSMKSSIEILKTKKGNRKIAILGNMLELGKFSQELHKQVGNFVYENNIDILCTVGDDAKFIADRAKEKGMNKNNIYSFSNNGEIIKFLKPFLKEGDTILLKASNGMHFVEIAENLK